MKILTIRIKNLASLEGITEIDFTQEPLISAGIFSITGPTGAGKSTILDALCLALYAKTPRYKQAESGVDIHDVQGVTINQNDVRGILRDGTADGFAEVDFVGVDNQHYGATWMVRRARNKAEGNLQAYDITLKNISTNSAIPGRKTELLEEIERLVGLNFEQFTRSVLLAQGDFTAFLKAGKNEKSALLEKLTGTNVYSEISKRVFEKHREQAHQLRDLNIQREGILTLTSEELEALKVQKEAIEIAIQAQEKLIVDLGKKLSWHEQWTNLQSSLESARLQYNQTTIAKQEALPREDQLQQIVRVQSVRPMVTQLHTTQSQFKDKSISLEQLTAQLSTLQQQKEALDLALQQAEANLNAMINEQEAAQPLLNSAKELDVQLKEKEIQVHQAKAELDAANEKQKRQQEQFMQKKQDTDLLEKEISQLHQWKEKNTARQPIAEQHSLIISKLSDAETLLETQQNRLSLMLTAEKEINLNQQENDRLDKEHSTLQESLQQAVQDYESQKEILSATPITSLEQEKANLDAAVEDVIAAEAHWKLLHVALGERDTLQKHLEDNRKELETNLEQLAATKTLLETASIQRNTSINMLKKARLTAAENVESLRTQLVSEEPCPVCGSTSHPYAEHHTQLDHVLRELEAGHQQIEVTYTDSLTTHSRLMQVCDQLNKTIGVQETDFPLKAKSVQHLEEIWTGFKIYTASEAQAIDERATWLRKQLQQEKERQHQLREQILSYGVKKEQLGKQKSKLDELDRQLTKTSNALKDTERNLKSLQEQLANHKQEKQKADTGLENVQQSLSVYFTSEQWFQHWKTEPEIFTHQIQEFAGQWKINAQQLEEGIRQQGILTATLKGIQEQWNSVLEESKQKEQNLLQIQAQWSDLTGKRKAIFNGEPIATVENRLKESVNQTRQALDQQKAERETLLATLTRTTTQKELAEKDLSTLLKQEASLREKIEEWIHSHNLQHAVTLSEQELQQLLSFTQDRIESEQLAVRAIDDAVMQAKSVWTEREHALERHLQERLSERTSEELIALQAEAKVLQRQNSQTFNEIGFRLRDDATNKQRIGTLLQTIEEQSLIVDNWAKLNEIIGSADGNKFRQVAQEYTLDVLLSYANVHLAMLSKRYVLQRIPHSLGLQVLDQDMGDQIRTVYSLSGGESFLVSLALALGLASLSSSRMKVESLFIDEGFGSLDPATLNIAMDALERLHNQGRKVGVISHVQEMTERIQVQIKVSKQHSGKSKIEIVGI